ncbi:MAG: ROK family transcriptional regulator [Rhodobacteraceae bacterium]|nr:ROK family transcriptional regulator [Paracoccaceae bacterium]
MTIPDKIVGANAERSRSHNRKVVLDRIRASGEVGRAEIARTSGLSTQAVSNIIADLLDDGLINELGRRSGVRGLPAVQYGLNPKGGFALGVEIRPDAVFAAAIDLCGTPILSRRQILFAKNLRAVSDTVLALSHEVKRDVGVPSSKLLGTGIVMPGPFEATGLGGSASELPIWHDVDPQAWFEDLLGGPVVVANDANAAAVSERVSGAAKGLSTYAYLYFGTGLGLGIVQDGRLVTGAFGNAGEIGHIPVPSASGVAPLESMVSRLSVQNYLATAGIEVRNSNYLSQAYSAGQPALMDWLSAASGPLSTAIAIVENMLDPETVILGGALPDAIIDHFLTSVTLPDRSVSYRSDRAVPRLMRGGSGRMTATLGGAALIINRTFMPQIAA